MTIRKGEKGKENKRMEGNKRMKRKREKENRRERSCTCNFKDIFTARKPSTSDKLKYNVLTY